MRVAAWRLAMVVTLAALVFANGLLAMARCLAKWVGAGADRAEIGWLLSQVEAKLVARERCKGGDRHGL